MKIQTITIWLTILAVVQFGSCSFSRDASIVNNYYGAITHCPGKEVESWTCKHCSKVPTLSNVTYIDNARTHIVGFVGY